MTKKKPLGVGLSREERMVLVIGEIIQECLKSHHEQKDVNLNRLKQKVASKYGIDTAPRLVDIIAAVPHDAKKILLPKLKAKPVRTASGVSCAIEVCNPSPDNETLPKLILDCSRRFDVQAPSLSPHQLYWKHLRLLSRWPG